jgi:crossover junction endodeoxyribonuclease RuvC
MIVMGIDPGSAITGFGVLSGDAHGKVRCLKCGCVRTQASMSFEQRLKTIHDEVDALIRSYGPEQIAFEEIFVGRNVRAAFQLGHARAAAMIAAVNAGVAIYFYAAREIKQALTGYGAASKQRVQNMVSAILQLDLSAWPLDASDALALAICHYHRAMSLRSAQGTRS